MTQDDFLHYWPSVRKRTTRLVACIPPDRVEWSPAAGRWSLGDTVRHLAAVERWMYAETVHGRPVRYPGYGRELAEGLDGITSYLARCHTGSMAEFQALTLVQWQGKCLTPAGTPITTWKWLRAMIEHEAHHRGQIYMMLGLLGVATPPLFGLTEPELQAIGHRP
jgi:uncharacterized damage-inducible protein DinB